jgi:translocation and assembly module TamA
VVVRIAIVVLGLAVAGCASTHVKNPVKSVKVQGNQAFGDKSIVSRLATRPPQGFLVKTATSFDPIALELDRRRVEAFYHERGYFDAQVTDVKVQRTRDGGASVEIDVTEGEPTQVASLSFDGVKADFARGVLREHAPELEEGRRLDHPAYLLAKDALQQALVKAGYAHAEVSGVVEVDRTAHRAVVRLDADPGPLVRFGKVTIEGLKTVPESTVRARLAFGEGERFDPEALDATEGKLYALGLFSSVRADWAREGRPEVSDITIKVTEGTRHEVRFGVGAGVDRTHWEVRARGGYVVHGILGSPLNTLRLDARPGYAWLRSLEGESGPTIEASAQLERDDFFLPRLKGTALVAFDREPREGYTLTGPRVNLGVSRPFFRDDSLTLGVGWEFRAQYFEDADPLVFSPEALAGRLAYYEQRLVLDRRDAPLDARRGYYGELELDEGGPYAGGEVAFLKVRAEARGYLPAGRFIFAGRLGGGRLDALDTDETPLPVRFYGGGATDHRGFGFRRLSPMRRDATGRAIPIGGDTWLLGTAEARFDLVELKDEWLTLAVFMDAGDVTSTPRPLDLGDLHYAAGVGLRYDTLIGPVRLDLGYRLNRTEMRGPDGLDNPDPGQRFAFHFSLGEAF